MGGHASAPRGSYSLVSTLAPCKGFNAGVELPGGRDMGEGKGIAARRAASLAARCASSRASRRAWGRAASSCSTAAARRARIDAPAKRGRGEGEALIFPESSSAAEAPSERSRAAGAPTTSPPRCLSAAFLLEKSASSGEPLLLWRRRERVALALFW